MTDLHTALHLPPTRRRRSSRKRRPLLPAICFVVLGVGWVVLMALALKLLRPHPLVRSDYLIGLVGVGFGLCYFWVAYAVYRRRKYILTTAFVCAGFGLLNFPIGTVLAVFLLSSLVARKHDFIK